MIKAIDANMYLLLFVENIAPIQEIDTANCIHFKLNSVCLLYTSPSPRDSTSSRMPSSA